MRLVVTVERYAPAIGGAERVAQRVAEGLARREHEVHVVTGGPLGAESRGGVRVHRFPVAGNEARGIKGDAGQALDTILGLGPDLIFNYAAQSWPTDCCMALLERRQRPPMVLAPCGFSGLHSRRYRGYFAAMPERLRRYDGLIFHSERYQDWQFAVSAGADRRFVVANGADPPAGGERLRAQAAGRQLVVTVGSHVVSKGHRDFARATALLGRERRLTAAIVAPPRRGLDALRGCQLSCGARALARRQNLALLDGTDPGIAPDAVAAADLFLFTSRVECAPLVIIEAMAAGTPWVSYEVGNVAELAGGVVVDGFADLVKVAGAVLDGAQPELSPRGRAAWEAGHRWEDLVPRYESVFEEVVRAPVVR